MSPVPPERFAWNFHRVDDGQPSPYRMLASDSARLVASAGDDVQDYNCAHACLLPMAQNLVRTKYSLP